MSVIDGKCGNSEPGSFGHECGKPAVWIGTKPSQSVVGSNFHGAFCAKCKREGWDAKGVKTWEPYAGGKYKSHWSKQ
jgi:hypothetical protein